MAKLEAKLETKIAEVKRDIAEVKAGLLKWIAGVTGFQTIVIFGALASLVRIFAK